MLRCIGDRLLRDAIKAGADARRQIVDLADDGNFESGAALFEAVPACNEAFEAEREAEFLDVGRAQAHERAAQRFHHARRRARDAPAFLEQRRTFALRCMGGGGGLRGDGGERLAEFVVQFAGKMAPLLVLHGDQLSRQRVAFGEGGLQLLRQRVEDVGNRREFREIETGQARGKIVRRKLRQPGVNDVRRPQRARERGIDRKTKPRQGERHDGEQAARLAPALADLRGGVEGRDRHALGPALNEQRHRDRLAGMKNGAIERGETFGRDSFVGERAAADTLAKIAGFVPIGDAEARLHQRRRDPLQIRRSVGRQGKPLHLRLLQRDILGDDFGDTARLGPGGPVAVKQGVGRDSEEANRRERRDA